MKNRLITLGLLTAMLALTGCNGQTSSQSSSQTSEQTTSQTSEQITSQTDAEQTTTEQTTANQEETQPEQTESQPEESTPAENETAIGGVVSAQWADEFLTDHAEGEYTTFTADSSEFSGKIVFSADKDVSDFKLLSLTYEDMDDEGNITYSIEELYTQDTLTADMALVVELTFVGEIPNFGISYDNHTGEIQRFTLSESGYDGSVILSAF
ncbi:MAG: hypothetical protein ACI4KM_04560 [Oscillospiraceae bacterium]